MDLTIFNHQPFHHPLASIASILALLSFFYYLWVVIIRPRNNIINRVNSDKPEVLPASVPEVADMSDNYGPIFMVRFGMHPTLVVSSWEMCKECFTTNDRFLAGRPSATLAQASRVAQHVPYLEISNYMKQLHGRCMKSQNQNKEGSVKVDMSQVFGELTLNVVMKLIIGKSLFANNAGDHEEEQEGQKLYETILEFFQLGGVSVASDVLPFLGWLDVDGKKKQMKRVAKEMDLIASRWLEEHRQKKRLQTQTVLLSSAEGGGNDHDDANDFMDVLISILDEGNDDLFFGYNRDTVIKANCLNLILGGSDTTSITLTWILSLLLTHPNVLRKAQDELDNVVGKERNVEARDIKNLIYLQAILKETLRLYPSAPLSVMHEAIEDCTIGGYKVSTGTRLSVHSWKLHRDPRVWSNPLEFNPERFLPQPDGGAGEKASKDFWGQDFEYLPFGSGRRMCPGFNFACQIVHMVLARLLHAFVFNTIGLAINMTESPGLTMPKLTPLEVHLHPRLPITFSSTADSSSTILVHDLWKNLNFPYFSSSDLKGCYMGHFKSKFHG
ncbi:hypothetical protein C5167_026342 [Papaver somniferum]|nr:hypothetical protein C5167_026342 [Papaver somniferum]